MKKYLFISLLLLTNLVNAQNFPAESVELLLNKSVRTKEFKLESQKYVYRNFYTKFDLDTKKLNKYEKKHRPHHRVSTCHHDDWHIHKKRVRCR